MTYEVWQLPNFYLKPNLSTKSWNIHKYPNAYLTSPRWDVSISKLTKLRKTPDVSHLSPNQLLFSNKGNSILRSYLGSKFWSLPWFLSFLTPNILSISKSCWLYFQNTFRIQLFSTTTTTTTTTIQVQATVNSPCCSELLTTLATFALDSWKSSQGIMLVHPKFIRCCMSIVSQ